MRWRWRCGANQLAVRVASAQGKEEEARLEAGRGLALAETHGFALFARFLARPAIRAV
jgi:hypothetical protein